MKKILLVNQGNTENYGDIAIKDTLYSYFEKNNDVDYMSYWNETEIFGKLYNFRLLFRIIMKFSIIRDFFYLLFLKKNIKKNYDAIVIGGGELLSGHPGFNTALYMISKYFINTPKYLIGVSGNSNLSSKMKKRYKFAFSNMEKIYVRDKFTKEYLMNEYNIHSFYAPDVVFSYNKNSIKKINPKDKNTIIFSPIFYYNEVGNYLNLKSEADFINYLVKIIYKNVLKSEKLVICPTVKEDEEICKKIYKFLIQDKKIKYIDIKNYSCIDDYCNNLEKSKKIISCRMHGMILGLLYNCEIEPVVFKNKLKVFKDEYKSSKISIEKIKKEAFDSICDINNDINKI